MKRIIIFGGLAWMLISCNNDGSAVNETDTVAVPNTTNYGGAGTGGVGAGFGPGGRAGDDTNLPVGIDTARTGGNQPAQQR